MHASSFSHISVGELDAPGPIKLVTALMKLFNSRCGLEKARCRLQVPSRSIRDSDVVVFDSRNPVSRAIASDPDATAPTPCNNNDLPESASALINT
jgi:hypothetical protein